MKHLLAIIFIATIAFASQKQALIIGNSNYKSSPLKNPVNDARAMRETLKKLGFEVTYIEDGDRRKMREAISSFQDKIDKNSIALFYYAGHGIQYKGENYLMPTTATIQKEDEIDDESVPLGYLLEKLEVQKPKLSVVILDACRDNPFARSFRGTQAGLASIQSATGTLIAFATGPGKIALDGEGKNGLYTGKLIKHLNTPNLKIEEVFKKTREDVLKASNGVQVPWENSSVVGEYIFMADNSVDTQKPINRADDTEVEDLKRENEWIKQERVGTKKLYTHTVKQIVGDGQTLNGAKLAGIELAKREILEYAGTYIESQIEVKEAKLVKDEILSITMGVLKTKILEEKKSLDGNAVAFIITVESELETDGLQKNLEKLLNDRTLRDQNSDLLKKNRELLDKIAELEKRSKTATAKEQKDSIEKEYTEAERISEAIMYFEMAFALWKDGKHTNPKKAIEYLTKAIGLNPKDAIAYNNRGVAYKILGNPNQAIKDYDKAIELDPKHADIYYNRGNAYDDLGNPNQAIKDYDKAIELDPKDEDAYYNRGNAYTKLDNLNQAIKDYDKAIELNPKYANAYHNRGIVYLMSGNRSQGCRDANIACKLGNCKLLQLAKSEGLCP